MSNYTAPSTHNDLKMKNSLTVILMLIIGASCTSQEYVMMTYDDFDRQILDYNPQKNAVSEDAYYDALKYLAETQDRIKKNGNIDVSDYWNILTVFNNLDESNANIDVAFKKFVDEERSCEYIVSFEHYFDRYKTSIQSKLRKQLEICKSGIGSSSSESISIEKYAQENGFDKDLVETINRIKIDDQRNRDHQRLQGKYDTNNQKKIDSIYAIHQTYIGKSLVGDKFEHVMWAVIQHSNLSYMERYFPVVNSAVKNGELGQGALKFLIDRMYSIKYDYQVFGSQENVEMADDEIRKETKLRYNIE